MLRSELAEKIRRNCNWTIGTRLTSNFLLYDVNKEKSIFLSVFNYFNVKPRKRAPANYLESFYGQKVFFPIVVFLLSYFGCDSTVLSWTRHPRGHNALVDMSLSWTCRLMDTLQAGTDGG